MRYRYFAKGSEEFETRSSGKQASDNRETKYRVSDADTMTTDELIEAIRDKIQATLLIRSDSSDN